MSLHKSQKQWLFALVIKKGSSRQNEQKTPNITNTLALPHAASIARRGIYIPTLVYVKGLGMVVTTR